MQKQRGFFTSTIFFRYTDKRTNGAAYCRRNKFYDDTRLSYYDVCQMHLKLNKFWTVRSGLFMDLWERHRQYNGISKPKRNLTVNDIILDGACVQREFTFFAGCIAIARTIAYNKSADGFNETERSF